MRALPFALPWNQLSADHMLCHGCTSRDGAPEEAGGAGDRAHLRPPRQSLDGSRINDAGHGDGLCSRGAT